MKLYYDLHIHSGLSPCGDNDMTPNNIVNMSIIKGLDVISVTDHNSVLNFNAVKSVADRAGLYVICGMEVTTKEELHVLCYFKKYHDAKNVSSIIYRSLPDIENRIDYFGEQNIYDDNDKIIAVEKKLLISATKLSLLELNNLVLENNGIIVPAHVNKLSDGLLGVLGFYPDTLCCDYVEVSKKLPYNLNITTCFDKYKILYNSDAHYLKDISEPEYSIDTDLDKSLCDLFINNMTDK